MIDLKNHYGFTRTPFGKDLAPSMLHRYPAHSEAVARITWCARERALAVITGEVGSGKTAAARAAVTALDQTRHTLIYLPDPTTGTRGIHHHIVTALGGRPAYGSAVLAAQAAALIAAEHGERGRLPLLVVDEAHLLGHAQLEAIRLLTLCRDRDYAGDRQESPGGRVRACQASGIIPGPRGTRGACPAAGTCPSSSSATRSGPGPSP
jgi:type II secretory pathway predicted ATPase ExeA